MTVSHGSHHRIVTPANAVTVLRIVLAPIVALAIWTSAPAWWVLIFGFCSMMTDRLDGWLARRFGATDLGAFLDPLADKLIVLGSLGVLVARGWVWWLPVAFIAAREVGMSAWRGRLARRGVSVPSRRLAKVKTWSQSVAVALALTPGVVRHAPWLLSAGVWMATVLTVFTFGQYVVDSRSRAPALRGDGVPSSEAQPSSVDASVT